jgi:hypothetical protein
MWFQYITIGASVSTYRCRSDATYESVYNARLGKDHSTNYSTSEYPNQVRSYYRHVLGISVKRLQGLRFSRVRARAGYRTVS